MLQIEHLTKDYGNKQGIFDLSITSDAGEIIGLVGSNGSGKTTLLKSILQLLPVDEGTIQWNGKDIKDCFADIAYITDSLTFLPEMTPIKYGVFMKDFYPNFKIERYHKILEHFEIEGKKKLRKMSAGQKLKVEIAAGFSQGAHLLLLDEPFSNLDVFSKQDSIKMLISLLNDDETVLISTHDIDDVDQVIDRAIILKRGKLMKDVSLEELHACDMTLKDCMNEIEKYNPNRVNLLFKEGCEQDDRIQES